MILSNFRPTGYLSNVLLAIFKKISSPENGSHFEFLPKMEKHKFASISLTMRDKSDFIEIFDPQGIIAN